MSVWSVAMLLQNVLYLFPFVNTQHIEGFKQNLMCMSVSIVVYVLVYNYVASIRWENSIATDHDMNRYQYSM